MIVVHRADAKYYQNAYVKGDPIYVNPDFIVSIERFTYPDAPKMNRTTLTLQGMSYTIFETPEEILQAIEEWRS